MSDILLKEISNFSMNYTIQVVKQFPAEVILDGNINEHRKQVFEIVVCLDVVQCDL